MNSMIIEIFMYLVYSMLIKKYVHYHPRMGYSMGYEVCKKLMLVPTNNMVKINWNFTIEIKHHP